MAYTNPQQGNAEDAARLRKLVGQTLKDRRMDVGKTQRQLADELGLEYYTTISQIEGGKMRVPPMQMEAYAKALEMNKVDFGQLLLQHYDPVMFGMLFGKVKTSSVSASTAQTRQ